MDCVGDKSTLNALPAILDCDVPAPYQLKDFPRQVYKGLMTKDKDILFPILRTTGNIPQQRCPKHWEYRVFLIFGFTYLYPFGHIVPSAN